ncbi:hypothetical protein [Corynebacterium sp. A21]|uniref:hypothetical protein n=1 Tax=Corynebacterium sp. A21 TaxID=3457318 RepID=UPI003FCFB942
MTSNNINDTRPDLPEEEHPVEANPTESDPKPRPQDSSSSESERPGTDEISRQHDDELVDEWGEESFPASDPPAHF